MATWRVRTVGAPLRRPLIPLDSLMRSRPHPHQSMGVRQMSLRNRPSRLSVAQACRWPMMRTNSRCSDLGAEMNAESMEQSDNGLSHIDVAREFAELEGVEQIFDSLVKDILEASRQAAMKKILGKPGRAPSAVVRDVAVLDGAMEKIERNLRSQYADYLSAYINVRVNSFTAQELARLVAALKEEPAQTYVKAVRRLQRRESMAPVEKALEGIMLRATRGAGPGPGVASRAP
jgi:hypothetical protein